MDRIRIYNCTVCRLGEGVPAGANVRVRGTLVMTVLRPGDFDLTDGESVRLYLDSSLMRSDGPVDRESGDA